MATGRFKTKPDVTRAMLSLRSYLKRFRRDFHGIEPQIKRFIDETIAVPADTVTVSGMQYVGEGYLTVLREFEKRMGDREVESILRS